MQILSSDLYESSYLYCCEARLIDIRLEQKRFRKTVMFTFEGDDKLNELRQQFQLGEAVVNIADYRQSMIELKRLMFDVLDGRQSSAMAACSARGYAV